MNPRAERDANMKEWYEEYWSEPETQIDRHAEIRLALLGKLLAGEHTSLRVLDAGCGLGRVVGALARDGHDAVGMDMSANALRVAAQRSEGCEFVEHSVEDLPWPVAPASFDVVVAFEVIEHLMRPRLLLEGAHEALKPGAHLALTTPYHGTLKNVALATLAFDDHFRVEGDHIRFFSDKALERLLRETGFAPIRRLHFGRIRGLWAGVFVWAERR